MSSLFQSFSESLSSRRLEEPDRPWRLPLLAGLAATLLGLVACDTATTTTVSVMLCDALITDIEPAPAAAVQLSSDGGSLQIIGKHFWPYSSGASVDATPYPVDATASPTEPPTPDPDPLSYPTRLVSVRIGGADAAVTAAYEQVTIPWVVGTSLEGEADYKDCAECTACLTNKTTGCGECDAACLGCEQVVEVDFSRLSSSAGRVNEDSLEVAVVVIGEGGQTPPFSVALPLACADSSDNDGDGLTDEQDPDCASSGISETP